MVFIQAFKDKILDDIKDRIVDVELGEDATAPTVSDTSLGSPVSGSEKTVLKQRIGDVVGFSTTRFNTDPAGAYRELGLFDADGDLALRLVHATINTTVTDDTRIRYSVRVFFE